MQCSDLVPRKRLIPLTGALCLVLVGIFGVSAASAQPPSHATATAAGDPAATAPEVVTPPVYLYNGGQITEREMAEKELICLQTVTNFQCYDTDSELQQATEAGGSNASPKTMMPDTECGGGISQLYTYSNKNYNAEGGIGAVLEARHAWYDFRIEMNDQTSSFKMGEFSGHLSENSGGGGYWYPGNTGACALQPNIANVYPSWNDRISSRYRN